MYCKNCGAELSDGSRFCRVCGAEQSQKSRELHADAQSPSECGSRPCNTDAIVGFVLSVISLFFNWFGLISLTGLFFSLLGYSRCRKKQEQGKGLAAAGIVVSIVSFLHYAVFFVIAGHLLDQLVQILEQYVQILAKLMQDILQS